MAAPRNPESGYAMLLVFAMSAIVAIGLYQQLPRAAFEAQREKEALLINHGEQYKRGIQLYVRKLGRYPAKMEDLDNTQNIRFLRKHFIDPMTGKEEWRLLHMGPNGKLIDSKIKTVDPNADQWHQGSITEFKSANSSDDGGTENANIATRKRPSDDQVQIPGQGMTPAGSPDSNLAASSNGIGPGGAAGATGATDPNAPPKPPAWLSGGSLPGMPAGQRGIGIPQAPTPQTGTNNGPTGSSDSGGGSVSSNGGYGSGPSTGGGFGGTPTTPTAPTGPPGYPGSANNGFGNNGFTQPGAQSNAANMINGLLTQPRPGGAPTGVGMQGIGGTVVGGLAGVASTYKGRGIKRYNDQEEYTKWEFFYDLGAEQAQAAQTQANMMNQGAKPGTSSSSSNTSSFSSVSPPTPPPPPPTTPQ